MSSNPKTLGIFALSILALAILVSSVSATTTTTFSALNQSQTLSPSNLGLYNITGISLSSLTGYISGENFSTFVLTNPDNKTLNIKLTNFNSNSYYGGPYTASFNATGFNASNVSKTVPVNVKYLNSFCNYGDINASTNNGLSMSVYVTNDGSGTQTNWNPLDIIEVQVTVYNNGNSDFNPDNLYMEMGLVQKGTDNNIINRLDWISGDGSKVSIGSLPSGESYTYTFKFKVDPKILSTLSGSSSYYLMVKTYSNSNGQNDACVDYSSSSDFNDNFGASNDYAMDVQMSTPSQSNTVIVDSTSLPALTTASCGQQITFNPEIYNVGSSGNTYSKQQILVTMYDPFTGTTQNQTIYGGLNPGEGASVPFTLKVPVNADEQQYAVSFHIYYGYTDNNGNYFNNYRYVSNSFSTTVKVSGSCVYATPQTTSIQAQLQSGGKAGQPLVIQATVRNSGNKTVSYSFGLEGYTSWATVSGINPSNITLSPGQSQNILINMNVNKDAKGDKQFYLDTYSNGYLITQQPLSLTVTPNFSLGSITGDIVSGSGLLWAFNIILIVAIIVVIVVVLRRSSK